MIGKDNMSVVGINFNNDSIEIEVKNFKNSFNVGFVIGS